MRLLALQKSEGDRASRRHTDAVRLKLLDYIDAVADLSAGPVSLPEQSVRKPAGREPTWSEVHCLSPVRSASGLEAVS